MSVFFLYRNWSISAKSVPPEIEQFYSQNLKLPFSQFLSLLHAALTSLFDLHAALTSLFDLHATLTSLFTLRKLCNKYVFFLHFLDCFLLTSWFGKPLLTSFYYCLTWRNMKTHIKVARKTCAKTLNVEPGLTFIV